MTHERMAIVGTAGSWIKTPWNDPGLWISSLNDAWRMKGFVRADAWYDLHPLDKSHYPEGDKVLAHTVPFGYYCRPKGHLEWLAKQMIPVWLNPNYLTQHPDAANWSHARAFPKAEVEAHFGTYFASSPGWMIGQMLMDGVKELHIYGIHLATEQEYIEQRPNFEMLCGALLGRGKRTMTVHDGLRRYESPDGMLVLPEASPVLSGSYQYAFQPRPCAVEEPIKWELHKVGVKVARVTKALKEKPRWSPWVIVPNPAAGPEARERLTTYQAQERLVALEALAADWQDTLVRLHQPHMHV